MNLNDFRVFVCITNADEQGLTSLLNKPWLLGNARCVSEHRHSSVIYPTRHLFRRCWSVFVIPLKCLQCSMVSGCWTKFQQRNKRKN